MFSSILILTLFASIAGQVLAQATFNISFNSVNITTSDILKIPDSPVATACASNITDLSSRFQTCGQNSTCLCSADTVTSFYDTETCMLFNLIATNKKAPVPIAGSNVLVGAYASACAASNITVPASQSALVLPPDWEGPFVAVLSTGPTVIVVSIGAMLGFSALYILSNLE